MKKTILTIFVTFLIFGTGDAYAKDLNVPGEYNSIKKAIDNAEDGDVVLVGPGTYYENIKIDEKIEVRSTSGWGNTVIDGNGKGTVVYIVHAKGDNGNVPKISGFTIRGGHSGEGRGGGITVYDADPVIENNLIISNSAGVDGGGILLNVHSIATIRNNIIDSNTAHRFGGAIHVVESSHALIYNNHILKNKATGANYGTWGSSGGAIFVDSSSSPQIINNVIEKNSADFAGGAIALRKGVESIISENTIAENDAAYGGGVHIETEGSSVSLINNEIKNNTAWKKDVFSGSGYGGGISIYNKSQVKVRDNDIHDNTGQSGGGGIVVSENANARIDSNNIYSNKSNISENFTGGGIYVANATAYIQNNNIYNNEAKIGGGIGLDAGANVHIQNNTIVNNKKISEHPVAGGINVRSTISASYIQNNIIVNNSGFQIHEDQKKSVIQNNLINDDSDGIYHNYNAGIIHEIGLVNTSEHISADSNISGDEKFVNKGQHDYHLNDQSDALDKGRNTGLNYDHDGSFRPSGSMYDIGAYEKASVKNDRLPVYRFWSDVNQKHFYTINEAEKKSIMENYPTIIWRYEGESYQAMPLDQCNGTPVHRFWSDAYQGHFYTMSESEKNSVIQNYPDNVWRYEGKAFCAQENKAHKTTELYRFWSNQNHSHFYTASAGEKNFVIKNYPDNIWRYEAVSFYVYPSR